MDDAIGAFSEAVEVFVRGDGAAGSWGMLERCVGGGGNGVGTEDAGGRGEGGEGGARDGEKVRWVGHCVGGCGGEWRARETRVRLVVERAKCSYGLTRSILNSCRDPRNDANALIFYYKNHRCEHPITLSQIPFTHCSRESIHRCKLK